jgi:hypothetical protein
MMAGIFFLFVFLVLFLFVFLVLFLFVILLFEVAMPLVLIEVAVVIVVVGMPVVVIVFIDNIVRGVYDVILFVLVMWVVGGVGKSTS